MNLRVDVFMKKITDWHEEYEVPRRIALTSGPTEDLTWGQPFYTLSGKNIFLLHSFKKYIAVFFIKGAIVKDPQGMLIQQTENVQAGRQILFKDTNEIVKFKKIIKAYVAGAIAIEEAGLQVPMKKPVPSEKRREFRVLRKALIKLF